MSPNDNRRAGGQPGHGGGIDSGRSSARIFRFPSPHKAARAGVFDELTDRLLMEQAEAGTLNPAIVAALLAAVRQPVAEVGQ